jgi:D-glycero-alpha-D-manno-heptose-7-phosphate kinase
MLIARAPMRISLGGGGTDLEAYYGTYGGLVISTAINKYF